MGSEGIGAGLKKVMPAFSGKLIPVVNDINKVNGLVNEYMSVFTQVRMRWRLGLGKYLLSKLSAAMQSKGILTVGKKSGAAGQWVYPTGSALGPRASSLTSRRSLAASPITRTSSPSLPRSFPRSPS